jgi:carboxypeptidase family protein
MSSGRRGDRFTGRRMGLGAAVLASVILVVSFSAGGVWAQVTASITGSVKDTSGAVVPGAAITAKGVERGLARTSETDSRGNYSLQSLPVGEYEISAEKPGFKQQVRTGITLVVGQQAVVNLTLEVGNVEQQVTVSGEASIVNTTLSPTSGLVGEKQVKDLPLNGRSFDQLLTLNVGTTNYSSNVSPTQQARNLFSVSGKRPESNRFLLNGIDYIGSDSSGQVITPTGASSQVLGVDAVREFNVVQHTYGAEYGKRAGGQISIVTSSGTNQLHGDAFEYLRNSVLDARNFFDRPIGLRIPPFKRNQFGGSVGGPIKKDKTFVFGNYEGFRQRLGVSSVGVVPDLPARQGLLPIGPGGSLIEVPNLKRGILPFFSFWPVPNGPELLQNGLPTGTAFSIDNPNQKIREDFGLVRFDETVSTKDSFSANYVIDDGTNANPDPDPIFTRSTAQRSHGLSLQETHVFSPTMLSVATLGFSRAYALSGEFAAASVPSNLLFITGTVPGSINLGGGIVSTVGSSIVPASGLTPTSNTRNLFTGADDIKWIRGKHSFSLGVWVQRVQQNLSGSPQATAGSVTYPTLMAFLQDAPTQFIAVPNPTPLGYRSTEGAWYVQDEIRVKPNLTLRLGLRHEMTNGWNEVTGRNANYFFEPNGLLQSDPRVGDSALLENNARWLFEPRVGVVWDPTGSGKWSVRAGFGRYSDLQDNLAHRLSANPPFNARLSRTDPLLSYIPLPGGTQPPARCTAIGQTGCSVFQPGGIDPVLHTPTVQDWSLTIEREITRDLMLQLGYVGSQSYHLPVSIDRNVAQPLVCSNPAGCVAGGVRAANQTSIVPQGTTYMPSTPPDRGFTLRPNPFVANTFSWMFAGTSSYQGFNASLVKRASHGLALKANYTFAKGLDLNSALTSSAGINEPQTILNPYNLGLNKGISAFILQQQFNVNYSYELPLGHGQHWGGNAGGVVEHLIGGWQWNGILSAQSGFTFTPQAGSNISGTGDSFNPDVPNWNPNFKGKVILGKPERWFDPGAFSLPLAGTFGNVSRGTLVGPRLVNFDTSLFKKIPLTERWALQFRAEAFNIFNHAIFASPNAVVFSGAAISPSAGVITRTATTSRQLQFALKLMF